MIHGLGAHICVTHCNGSEGAIPILHVNDPWIIGVVWRVSESMPDCFGERLECAKAEQALMFLSEYLKPSYLHF